MFELTPTDADNTLTVADKFRNCPRKVRNKSAYQYAEGFDNYIHGADVVGYVVDNFSFDKNLHSQNKGSYRSYRFGWSCLCRGWRDGMVLIY